MAHATVHYSFALLQYDYGGWMPNTPTTLQHPPPTTKGTADEETMLKTFPNVGTTVNGMAALWLLSKQSTDFVSTLLATSIQRSESLQKQLCKCLLLLLWQVPLGKYPEERFTEEAPIKIIKDFQEKLAKLSKAIKDRNKTIDIAYTYLDPVLVENSVSI